MIQCVGLDVSNIAICKTNSLKIVVVDKKVRGDIEKVCHKIIARYKSNIRGYYILCLKGFFFSKFELYFRGWNHIQIVTSA